MKMLPSNGLGSAPVPLDDPANVALARECLEIIRDIADRGACSWDPELIGYALQELSQVLFERTGCYETVFKTVPAGRIAGLRQLHTELVTVDAGTFNMFRPN